VRVLVRACWLHPALARPHGVLAALLRGAINFAAVRCVPADSEPPINIPKSETPKPQNLTPLTPNLKPLIRSAKLRFLHPI